MSTEDLKLYIDGLERKISRLSCGFCKDWFGSWLIQTRKELKQR